MWKREKKKKIFLPTQTYLFCKDFSWLFVLCFFFRTIFFRLHIKHLKLSLSFAICLPQYNISPYFFYSVYFRFIDVFIQLLHGTKAKENKQHQQQPGAIDRRASECVCVCVSMWKLQKLLQMFEGNKTWVMMAPAFRAYFLGIIYYGSNLEKLLNVDLRS